MSSRDVVPGGRSGFGGLVSAARDADQQGQGSNEPRYSQLTAGRNT
jgi:hypothetical protein